MILAACAPEELALPSEPPWDEPVVGAVAVSEWHDDGTPGSPFGPEGPGWDSPDLIVTALAENLGRAGDVHASGAVVERRNDGSALGWVRIEVPGEVEVALDMRLEMRESDGSWAVAGIESRRHCARPLVAGECE